MAITTEFLTELGIEKDRAVKILAERGKEIENEKAKTDNLKTELEAVKGELENHKATITQLEAAQGDSERVKSEFEDLKAKIAEDEKLQLEQAAKAEQQKRFDTVAEGKEFKHDFVRQGVLAEFYRALSDKANIGKADADIFAELTTDKDYFASQNPVGVASMNEGNIGTSIGEDEKARAVMGLPPQK